MQVTKTNPRRYTTNCIFIKAEAFITTISSQTTFRSPSSTAWVTGQFIM